MAALAEARAISRDTCWRQRTISPRSHERGFVVAAWHNRPGNNVRHRACREAGEFRARIDEAGTRHTALWMTRAGVWARAIT